MSERTRVPWDPFAELCECHSLPVCPAPDGQEADK